MKVHGEPQPATMRVVIRASADRQLGLGHVRRCLSLGAALRRCGADVRFLVGESDIDTGALIRAEGFPAAPVTGACSAQADADRSLATLDGARPDWVVVDHYGLDASWHERLRASTGARIAVIDDLADRPLAPDVLIDQNLVPDHDGHRARYAHRLTRVPSAWLCGPRFALLAPRFETAPAFKVRDSVSSIGIFMGGTDPASLSVPVLAAVRKAAGFKGQIEVVSTSANPALDCLRLAVQRDRRARLTLDLPDLCEFFGRHDLQIGAGGGATWERCRIGAPSLTLAAAANQQAVIPALAAAGAIATVPEHSAAALGAAVRRLLDDAAERRALSSRSRNFVDGRGALRCALALAAARSTIVALRPATEADMTLVWRWRNDPATRAVSRNVAEIAWHAHRAWMSRRLAEREPMVWVGHAGSVDFGVIRFDRLPGGAVEVSLFLDPGLHGLRLGSALLNAGERQVAGLGGAKIVAEVVATNPASSRLFAAAGYRSTGGHRFEKIVADRSGCRAEET